MKLKNVILLVSLFCFLSCNYASINHKDRKEERVVIRDNVSDIETIVADEFIAKVVEKDFLWSNIKEIYPLNKIQKDFFLNKHNQGRTDTLVYFSVNGDSIAFYKTSENILPLRIAVTSEKLIIDKSIHVGISKEVFRQKFNTKLQLDTLLVRDLEGGNVFMFFFQDDKLVKILYQAEYTD